MIKLETWEDVVDAIEEMTPAPSTMEEFINALKRSKEKYNKDEITILTSKIISLEQIKNDF